MNDVIKKEELEKLKALLEKIRLKKGKADKLAETIRYLIGQKVAEAEAKILIVLMKYLRNINTDCGIEEMLAKYETHIEELEALIDELEKCLREHYAKFFQNTGKPPPGPPPPGGRR